MTNAVASSVPTPYIVFGLAGGLPYLGATGATIYLARQAGIAAAGLTPNMDPGVAITMLDHALTFQMEYGAVMLSFLGALHWGFEFAGYGGHKGYVFRFSFRIYMLNGAQVPSPRARRSARRAWLVDSRTAASRSTHRTMGRVHWTMVGRFEGYRCWVEYVRQPLDGRIC